EAHRRARGGQRGDERGGREGEQQPGLAPQQDGRPQPGPGQELPHLPSPYTDTFGDKRPDPGPRVRPVQETPPGERRASRGQNPSHRRTSRRVVTGCAVALLLGGGQVVTSAPAA